MPLTRSKRAINRDSVAIGERVRMHRKIREITQKELAKAAGVTLLRVSRIERGDGYILAAELRQVARALGVSLDDVLGEAHS